MPPQFTSIAKLASTRVLIIGGTSGIGFGVSRAALEHGASIIISSSQPTNVDNALTRLREMYPEQEYTSRIAGFPCDLGNPETLETNVLDLLEKATKPDLFPKATGTNVSSDGAGPEHANKVLLNHIIFTAGDSLDLRHPTAANVDIPYLNQLGTVRLHAPIFIAKHSPTYLLSSADSSITLTSGSNTTKPMKNFTMGTWVGGAIEALTRGLAVDLAPVRVNTVSPGAVYTELMKKIVDRDGGKGEEMLARFRDGSLLSRLGDAEDVAEAYVYLMKDKFVTGIVLESSGGRLLK